MYYQSWANENNDLIAYAGQGGVAYKTNKVARTSTEK